MEERLGLALHFNFAKASVFLLLAAVLASSPAHAQTLTENFTTMNNWDVAATTATGSPGIWNINAGQSGNPGPCAMAPVMDNGSTNTAISFGTGSDGILNSASGFTFDTNAHPNGYNFFSVNITGGTVTVTGTNPLIIRSLTSVNITPAIDLDGGAGTASASGGAGGTAPATSLATGGNGGSTAGGTGTTGDIASGAASGGTGGAGCASAGAACNRGIQGPPNIPGDFDTTGDFIGGAAAGGGGGNSTSATTGGGGGAGGGIIQIAALGTLTVGTVTARGGQGGSNGTAAAGCVPGACPGSGPGGNGGSIWLQSFNAITVPGSVSVAGGATGLGNGVVGNPGKIRGDEPGAPAGWTTGGASGGAVGGVVPTIASSGTFFVVSTAYDLSTYNATFSTAPTVTPNAPVQFAASSDGSTFTAFTSDITTLSNQNFRYLKFKITLNAATQSFVSSISIPYDGPSLDTVNLSLAAGCGSLERSHDDRSDKTGMMMTGFWVLFYLLAWKALTASRRWYHYPSRNSC